MVAGFVGAAYQGAMPRTAHFFQELFGPAVMFAAGHGWKNPDLDELPALHAFLHPPMPAAHPPAIDRFDVASLPAEVAVLPWDNFQLRQRYLIYAVGVTWRLFGVSWSALTPLYALMYGVSAALLYGIFRLGAARAIAAALTLLLVFSPIQLDNLVRLRDYSKAPFILAAILLLGYMLRHRLTPRRLAAIALLFGVVTGIGSGFRMDVVMCLPAFVVVLLFFTRVRAERPWRARGLA